jgi:hypothetical protein
MISPKYMFSPKKNFFNQNTHFHTVFLLTPYFFTNFFFNGSKWSKIVQTVKSGFPSNKFNGMTYIPGSTWFLYTYRKHRPTLTVMLNPAPNGTCMSILDLGIMHQIENKPAAQTAGRNF